MTKQQTAPPERIYDDCPSCHPHQITRSTCSYTGEYEICDNAGEQLIEYIYQCDNCNALIWIDEHYAKRNEVIE